MEEAEGCEVQDEIVDIRSSFLNIIDRAAVVAQRDRADEQ